MKQKFFIDTHKSMTFFAVLAMMYYFDQFQNQTAWIYLALHGTYGLLWVAKSRIFPDRQWEKKANLIYGLVIWGGLSLYWIAPYLIASRAQAAPAWLMATCISLFGFGVFLHFTTDMQKYIELTYNPNNLITDGLFSKVRNTNYLGELLIYLSFALLSMHWLPLLVVALFFGIVWLPNMIKKEKSLSRYPGFPEYKNKSKFFIPFLY